MPAAGAHFRIANVNESMLTLTPLRESSSHMSPRLMRHLIAHGVVAVF